MFVFVVISQRFPDKEAGPYPMAYVARKPHSNLSEKQVTDFISKQVLLQSQN